MRPLRFTETIMPANRRKLLYSGGGAPEELLVLASDVSIFERWPRRGGVPCPADGSAFVVRGVLRLAQEFRAVVVQVLARVEQDQ